jgi:hypothetical protein
MALILKKKEYKKISAILPAKKHKTPCKPEAYKGFSYQGRDLNPHELAFTRF